MSATDDLVRAIEAHTGRQGRRVGRETRLLCPAHDDRHPSLDVREGENGVPLAKCRSHDCSFEAICHALGREPRDFLPDDDWRRPPPRRRPIMSTPRPAPELGAGETAYLYADEQGEPLFRSVRTPLAAASGKPGKTFRLESWDGSRWLFGLNGTAKVLYRLPDVRAAVAAEESVLIVEGERCADALTRLGFVATTSPMGAGKPLDAYLESLRHARVVVLGDCDEPGRRHAHAWVEALTGIAAEVRLVELDAARNDGYDIADLLAQRWRQNHDRAALCAEVEALIGRAVKVPLDSINSFLAYRDSDRKKRIAEGPQPLWSALAGTSAEVAWDWEGYLGPGTVTLFAGVPKVGKSTLLFGLVQALASGWPFLGLSTRQTKVLLLSEERGATLREKAERFGLGNDLHLWMRHEVRGISWPEVVAQATAYAARHEIGVLVVDTADKWWDLRGDAENSSGATIEALEPLSDAAAAGLAVLITTHQRKSGGEHGEAVRGSNALAGAVDVIVELERAKGEFGVEHGGRVLLGTSRFAHTPELLAYVLNGGEHAAVDPERLQEEAQAERVRAALADEYQTVAEIAAATGTDERKPVPQRTVAEVCKALFHDGYTDREGEGKRGSPFRYRLPGDGEPGNADEDFSADSRDDSARLKHSVTGLGLARSAPDLPAKAGEDAVGRADEDVFDAYEALAASLREDGASGGEAMNAEAAQVEKMLARYRGALTRMQGLLLVVAGADGDTLDPYDFYDAAVIVRAETLVEAGCRLRIAIAQAREQLRASKHGLPAVQRNGDRSARGSAHELPPPPDAAVCDEPTHLRLWGARDGRWRCFVCEPPRFAGEVAARAEAEP